MSKSNFKGGFIGGFVELLREVSIYEYVFVNFTKKINRLYFVTMKNPILNPVFVNATSLNKKYVKSEPFNSGMFYLFSIRNIVLCNNYLKLTL